MAWTTRIVNIDEETGEILNDLRDYHFKTSEIIYTKINPTHNERIIIKKHRRSNQHRIKFQ